MEPKISHNELDDNDARVLWNKINQIIDLAHAAAQHGSSNCHSIYAIARDCRDLLLTDQAGREMMRRLQDNSTTVMGLNFPESVQSLARHNRLIEAIKELRVHTGCGLKEAKDAVETWMAHNVPKF